MNKAVFLDRDGVINVDHGYVSRSENFEFSAGVFSVLKTLMGRGYLLIVVTNQSGIGRGYYTQADFLKLNNWMLDQFAKEGVEIGGVYWCPHRPDERCDCRKPKPGLLQKAIREHEIDPALSWMIGDKSSDMEVAAAVGMMNRVMLGGKPSSYSTYEISELNELLDLPI